MTTRLIDTLPKITIEQMAKSKTDWIPASRRALNESVTVMTIYNRIKKKEIEAVNFEGRVFVKNS